MKKLLYSLLTLAAALTVTSCLKEVEGGAVYDDGTFVDATFSVVLGPQTKATASFADGTKATVLYAGLYEVDNIESPTTFTHVAHSDAQSIDSSTGKGKVEFPAGLQRGKSYAVFFWAEASGAPYTIDWAAEGTTGPSVTVTTSGTEVVANDETRDAFTGVHVFGPVSESVNTEDDPSLLRRPFAQINILVPNENVDVLLNALADGERRSSMTVSGLPNKVFLATGATEGNVDYEFLANNIKEAAFGKFADTHQYMAMNYVLYGAADTNYPVTFSVVNKEQTATNKTISVPLKVNTRTNIVGNIFADNFDYSGWVSVTPGLGNEEVEEEIRSITITVGGMQISSLESVAVGATSVLQLDFPGTVNGSITATSSDEGVAMVSVNQSTKEVTVTGVADGAATITIVIPGGTKADYAARTVKVDYKVGNGGDQTPTEQVATPTFSPGSGAVAVNTEVTISCETADAEIRYTVDGSEPNSESTLYNPESKPVIDVDKTIKAIAIKEGMTDSEIATAAYTISGSSIVPVDPTFSIDKTNVPEEKTTEPFDVTLTNTSDGTLSIAVEPEGAATVALKTGETNVYTVTPASNLAEDTNTTVTFSVAATAEFNAASDNFSFVVEKETPAPTTYTVTLSGTPDLNGNSFSASKTTEVEANEEITLTPTPANGYVFVSWTVKGAGNQDVEVTDNKFNMPASNVTITATFEHVGQGTQADPYTVAGVRAYIDGTGYDANAQVYVAGVVSELTNFKFSTGSTASFWLTADGQASDVKFEAYMLKYLGGNDFAAGNPDIELGNSVILYGKVTKYSETYETTKNAAYLYSLDGKTAITQKPTITGAGDVTVVPAGDGTLEITLASEDGATIYYTTDGTAPSNTSAQYSVPFTIDAACTIKAIAYAEGKVSSAIASKSFTKDGGSGSGPNYASIQTSNVTLNAGTNGSVAQVNSNDAIKVGTSKLGGDMSVTVPAGTKKLHVHAAAWNGVTGLSLNISGATTNPASIALNADTGIANNSPFTLAGDAADFYFEIGLSNIASETEITFTSSSAKRFVVWGVNAE